MTKRYTVVGGIPRKAWTYLDDETQLKGFRIYLVRDEVTHQQFWATDFRLRGVSGPKGLGEYTMMRIEDVTTRRQAFDKAKHILDETPLPEPQRMEVLLER